MNEDRLTKWDYFWAYLIITIVVLDFVFFGKDVFG